MLFEFIQTEDSKSWSNKRWMVQIQHMKGSVNFVVFVAVSEDNGEVYDTLYPRFDVTGKDMDAATYNAGSIAETLVRELRKLPEDTKLSKVKKILKAAGDLLKRAYGQDDRRRPGIIVP